MGEEIDRMKEWFGRALDAADFDLRLQDKEKGKSWKESSALFLFNKMMGHVNKMMDSNPKVGQVHAIKVANYALMITTRLVDEDVPIEVESKKTVIRELIHTGASNTESSVEFGPPIIAGEAEPEVVVDEFDIPNEDIKASYRLQSKPTEEPLKAKSDPIIETGLPPLDLGPLPNGPVEPKDKGYYCPWCEHTAKLGVGCRGKICCILCGKPIDSKFAMLLKKARQFNHVIMKKPITSAKMAKYLGTSSNWAGQVLAQLGWKSAGWRKGLGARWNPPKEDGK